MDARDREGANRRAQTVLSGLLNLLQLLVVLRGIVLLRTSGREAEALFLSNLFTLHQALLVVSSLKVEFADRFSIEQDRLPLAALSGVAFALASGLLVVPWLFLSGVEDAPYYAGTYVASALVTATYHAYIAGHRLVAATLLKGGPFLVAVPLLMGGGLRTQHVLLAILAATASGLVWVALARSRSSMNDLARTVRESAWALRHASLVAVANAFAVNVIYIVIQGSMTPEVTLDYFEHLRLFVGPLTVVLFPIGQRIYARVLDGDGAATIRGLARARVLVPVALSLLGMLGLCYPAYGLVARWTGLEFVQNPTWFMYAFVLATSAPRAVMGLWFPLVLSLRLHSIYLVVLVARVTVAALAIAVTGNLNMSVLILIATAEVVGVGIVARLIFSRLEPEVRPG